MSSDEAHNDSYHELLGRIIHILETDYVKKNVSIYIEDIFEPRGPPDITALRSHYSLHSHLLTDSLGYHVPTECVEAALKMRSNEQPLLCRWDPFELSPFWDLETNIFDSEYSSTESAFGSPLSSNFPLAGGSSDSGYSTSLDNDSPETTDATTSSDFLGHISVADRFKDDKEGSVDLVSLSEDDSNRECDSDSQLVGSPSSLSHESVTSREGKERHESSARQKDYGKQSKDLEDLVDGCSTSHVIQDTYQHRANSPDKTPTTIEDGDKSSSSSLTLTQSRATTPNLVPPSRAPTLFASAPSGDGSDNDSYREERTLKRKRAKSESSPDAAPTRRRPRKAPRAPPKNAKPFVAGATPWQCVTCEKTYMTRCSLKRHLNTSQAHGKHEFRCPGPKSGSKCGGAYMRHSSFRRHLQEESAECKARVCSDHGVPANLQGLFDISTKHYWFPIEE